MPRGTHQPGHNVESSGRVQADGISVEQVRHNGPVAIGRELVRDELNVDEAVADHVREDEDAFLRGAVGGVGDVSFGWACVSLLAF